MNSHLFEIFSSEKNVDIMHSVELFAYSTETGRSVHGKLDSRSVATRGLFFTPDLWV